MLGFILKGLLRDHHRSLLPIITIGTGVMLMTAFDGYMKGVKDDMLSTSAKLEHGHMKVMTKEYAKIAHQMPNDLAIVHADQVLKKLKTLDHVDWVSRIKFGGLLDIPNQFGETRSQGPVRGIGIDLISSNSTEVERLDIKAAIIEGQLPSQQGEVLVSKKLGENLDIKLGDTATLIGSTATGSMAIYNFKVVGFINIGIPMLDRNMMLADITDIQYALDMENSVAEILGFFKQGYYSKKMAEQLKQEFSSLSMDKKLNGNELTISSIEEAEGLGEYFKMMSTSMVIIIGVLLLLMSIIVWNSSLMSGLRRYGEMGVRLAMGESKKELLHYMLYESALIGLIGATLGASLGMAFCYYLQVVGFDVSETMQKSTVLMSPVMRARVTIEGFFIGLIPGVLSCIIGTAMAGMGIYRRNTASLFKELEV